MMLRCTRDRTTGLSLPAILLITLFVTLSPYSLPDRHALDVLVRWSAVAGVRLGHPIFIADTIQRFYIVKVLVEGTNLAA